MNVRKIGGSYMKISVIIPVYNVEKYIEDCLKSVLNQSYANIEILIVNDGSTDNSGYICERYSKEYNNIKLINKKNKGLSAARNTGIQNSSGDYLIFLDSDDYWDKDFLTSLVQIVKKDVEIDYVFFRFKYYYEKRGYFEEERLELIKEKISKKPGIVALKEILSKNQIFQWIACRCLVRRELIIENQIYFKPDRYFEDVLWTPKVFLNASKIDYYDDDIYVYRLERNGQITSQFTYKNLRDSFHTAQYWEKELDNYEINKKTKDVLMKTFVNRYHYAIWFSGFIDDQDREKLMEELEKSRNLLKYKTSPITYITSILCNLLGYRITSMIFKHMIRLKRRLRRRHVGLKEEIKGV